jgi:hypothetical protein
MFLDICLTEPEAVLAEKRKPGQIFRKIRQKMTLASLYGWPL